MKNKVILLLVAVVVLASLALVGCGEVPPAMAFVAPAQTTYYVGDTLDLTGAKVTVYQEDGDVVHNVTTDMLDATTLPNFNTPGKYTVKGAYQDFVFSFEVEVLPLPTSKYFVSPARKTYPLGYNKFNLEGSTVTVEGTTVDVTTDMLDATTLPNFLQVGNYTVKGAYQGFEFSFVINVYSPLEFKHDTDFVYTRSANVAPHIWMRVVNSDGTTGEWENVTNNDIVKFELKQGVAEATLAMHVNNVDYNYTATFTFDDVAGISVSQLKQNTVGDNYYVNGIVVAITTTVAHNELILADKVTGEVISVRQVPFGGTVQSMDFDSPFTMGDEVVFPVTLAQAEVTEGSPTGDCNKLYANYIGGDQLDMAILSTGNVAPINYANATEVTTQAELRALLSSTNRAGNVYTMVHLKGEMGFALYASSRQIRFWFMDGNVTSLAKQKIDGNCSPVFCDGTQYYTTGATFSEMVLGNKSFSNNSYTDPEKGYYDIYALFIGGNTYYHKFVILKANDAGPMQATVTGNTFTAPTVVNYTIGSTLNLAGAKVTTSYDIKADEETPVTLEMLDASTIPTFTQVGTFTVKGSYQGYEFSFEVVISDKMVDSIAVETAPTKSTYTHRDSLLTLDLTGGTIRVNYNDGTHEVVDMDASMLPVEDTVWTIGTANYTLTYWGKETTLAITYQNTALTISQVLQKTPEVSGEGTTVYEVTGVVVNAVSSYAAAELLIMEKGTNVVIGVWTTAIVGGYNSLKLDTTVVQPGDEIVFNATLEKGTADTSSIGMRSKVFLRAQNKDIQQANLKKVSTGNSTNIALADENVTVIDSQDAFATFLSATNRPNNYYTYVKFVGLKAIDAGSSNYNIFFDGVTSETGCKINSCLPRIYLSNAPAFKSHLTNSTSTSYSEPATANGSFYALFIGGNSKYHHFAVLQDSWYLAQ